MEPPLPPRITEVIAELAETERPLLSARLAELSNLSSSELGLFQQVWPAIETMRRQQIIRRLVELAENNVRLNFDAIFVICLKDADAGIRSQAIEGLWENQDASLITPLIDLLEHDSSGRVRATAATALGKFAMLAEHQKLRPHYASRLVQTLLAAVNDTGHPVEVRRRALESVAPLNLPGVKKAITEAYHSQDSKLKAGSVHAMGKNCDPSWLPIVLRELTSNDNEIRYEAASACGELGEEEAVPTLIKLTGDADIEVQLAAIRALGKMGGTEAKKYLVKCLKDRTEAVQQAAAQALNELEMGEDPFSLHPWLE
ncbi:HEAT repeat domain-containing protein [Chloroflexota bacterium]